MMSSKLAVTTQQVPRIHLSTCRRLYSQLIRDDGGSSGRFSELRNRDGIVFTRLI